MKRFIAWFNVLRVWFKLEIIRNLKVHLQRRQRLGSSFYGVHDVAHDVIYCILPLILYDF